MSTLMMGVQACSKSTQGIGANAEHQSTGNGGSCLLDVNECVPAQPSVIRILAELDLSLGRDHAEQANCLFCPLKITIKLKRFYLVEI